MTNKKIFSLCLFLLSPFKSDFLLKLTNAEPKTAEFGQNLVKRVKICAFDFAVFSFYNLIGNIIRFPYGSILSSAGSYL